MSLARSTAPLLRRAGAAAPVARRAFTTASADGVRVAAADDGARTSTVTVAIKAGPRFETAPGLANVLKNYTFKSTDSRSALRLVREAELNGGQLSATLSKEHLFLTAEFLRGDEELFLEILGGVLSSQNFLAHEFNEEVVPAVASEYASAQATPSVLAFDVLAQTAFRQRGLGASLFGTPASHISHEQAVAYAKSAFSKSNIAVLGSGIESGSLASLVAKHFSDVPASGGLEAGPSSYYGGEARVAYAPAHAEGPRANDAHLVIGFEGAAAGSAELAILRAHLGGESSVKWASGLSPLSKIAESVPGAKASAFNLGFSDAGLFGAYVTAPHANILNAAKQVAQAIKATADSLSGEDLQRAVAKAKFEAAAALDRRADAHTLVGAQLLGGAEVHALDDVFAKLEGVNASALSKAAEKLTKSKPTLVAVGDVFKLPYSDELF